MLDDLLGDTNWMAVSIMYAFCFLVIWKVHLGDVAIWMKIVMSIVMFPLILIAVNWRLNR